MQAPHESSPPPQPPASAVEGRPEAEGCTCRHPALPVRVAVVDDEEGVRFAMRHILDSTGEFLCVGDFSSASAALTGLAAVQAQVVLMDAGLPDLSGIECTRRLKQVSPDLKVILMTGHEDSETIRQSFDAGASQFLVKPFSAGQCRAAIRMALFSSRRAASG